MTDDIWTLTVKRDEIAQIDQELLSLLQKTNRNLKDCLNKEEMESLFMFPKWKNLKLSFYLLNVAILVL